MNSTRFLASFLALGLLTPLVAQTNWTGSFSSDWLTGSNWSAGVPNGSTGVVIDNSNTVILSAAAGAAASIQMGAASGTATLNIQSGATLETGIVLFGYTGSTTTAATVTGTGSSWTSSADVFIADYATVNVTVSNGGSFSSSNGGFYLGHNGSSTGNLTVTGAGSTVSATGIINVGEIGTGRLTISDGAVVTGYEGKVNSNSSISIGGTYNGAAAAPGSLVLTSGNFTSQGAIYFNHTSTNYTFSTSISGGNNVINHLAGVTSLTAANLHSGNTNVLGGTLLVNNSTGSATGSGVVIVSSGATLGGGGRIAGPVTINSGATLAPGNSGGTITFTGGLSLLQSSILSFELGTSSDLIMVTGGTLSGPSSGNVTLNISALSGFGLGSYDLIDFSTGGVSTVNFSASSFVPGSMPNGYNYTFEINSNKLQLLVAIPEPSTYAALFGLGALGLAAWRRRRVTA